MHPNVITRLSKQLPFHPSFYLTSRQQNITIKTSESSNQNDLYDDSEFCNGGKDPRLFMVSHRRTHKVPDSLPEQKPRGKCFYSVFFWSVFSRISTKYRIKMRENTIRKTPNTDIFHAVFLLVSL